MFSKLELARILIRVRVFIEVSLNLRLKPDVGRVSTFDRDSLVDPLKSVALSSNPYYQTSILVI